MKKMAGDSDVRFINAPPEMIDLRIIANGDCMTVRAFSPRSNACLTHSGQQLMSKRKRIDANLDWQNDLRNSQKLAKFTRSNIQKLCSGKFDLGIDFEPNVFFFFLGIKNNFFV